MLFTTLAWVLGFGFYAQNLVPNPSFEDMRRLPSSNTSEKNLDGNLFHWYSANRYQAEPATLLSNEFNPNYGSPNPSRYQIPRTGNAALIVVALSYRNRLYGFNYYRNYPSVKLKETIPARSKIYAEFWVSWHGYECCRQEPSSFPGGQYGMYLYKDSIFQDDLLLLDQTPQINLDTLLTDTVNWVKVSGTFISQTELNYLSIGNFYTASQSQYLLPNYTWELQGGQALFFLDDAYVRVLNPRVPDTLRICLGDSAHLMANGEENHAWAMSNFPTKIVGTDSVFSFLPFSNTLVNFYGSFDTLQTYVVVEDINLDLGEDKVICKGEAITLKNPISRADSVIWSTGETTDSITVSEEGWYGLTLFLDACTITDSILLEVADTAAFEILPYTQVCLGNELTLAHNADRFANLLWTNGSNATNLAVTEDGWYGAEMRNPCGVSKDSIWVEFERCVCKIHIPTAFTPNNDGLNDVYRPVTKCQFDAYQIRISNRWGEVAFHGNNPNEAWRATNAPAGVYLLYIYYRGLNEKGQRVEGEFTEKIHLIR